MNWLSVMVSKILGCALSIGGGLALGREGPSIQIGAMVGKGFARTNKRVLTEERYLMSCGAGAGLSAAFGAPLAGTIFCLEELFRNSSWKMAAVHHGSGSVIGSCGRLHHRNGAGIRLPD